MAKHIGLARTSKGWFGIIFEDGGWEADLFPSVLSLWKYHSDASRVLLDVPIGLPAEQRRACDVEAKAKLRGRGGRVFYAPVREAVYEGNLDDARRLTETAGFSIQNQVWSLVPRIREVDEFLDVYPSARDRFDETRPELCFYALNGRTPVAPSKRTAEGVERRVDLLADEHPEARTVYEESVARFARPSYAPLVNRRSDIIDALVAAVTARRDGDRLSTVPQDPPRDGRGLPMSITYPSETTQTRLESLGSYG